MRCARYTEDEKKFRNELKRRLSFIKARYGTKIFGGSWGGVMETISNTKPYILEEIREARKGKRKK